MKIRMGVIGLGGISDVHIRGIFKSLDAELFAICDIDKEKLTIKKEELNIPEKYCFENYKNLVDCAEIDAISICTPNDSHFEIAMYCINKAKPFAVEKPVTLNASEAQELLNAADKKNVKHMVCFSYRFKGAARYAKYLVESGELGTINHVYGEYYQAWGISTKVPLVWRFIKERSGSGALADLGCHMLDLIRFTTGEIKSVIGDCNTIIDNRKLEGSKDNDYRQVDVDDYFHCLLRLENGISGIMNTSRFSYGRGNYQNLQIYGDKGAVVYNLEHDDRLFMCYGNALSRANDFVQIKIPEEFQMDQMQQFFNIINNKGDGLAATLVDGFIVQNILDKLLESSQKINFTNC